MLPLSAVAGDVITEDDNVSLVDEWPYVVGVDYVDCEVIVLTNYFVNLSEYNGNGPFDFNGVLIDSIVPLFDATTDAEIAARIERMGNLFSYHLVLNELNDVQTALTVLLEEERILAADPNFIFEPEQVIQDPVEEFIAAVENVSQWAHDYLEMDDVWNYGFTGSSDIIVAVFDVGFVEHPDLQDNMDWENGFDATGRTDSVFPEGSFAHGIMCAGVVCADYDDEYINGVCQNVTVLPIKVSADNNSISLNAVMNSADDAIALGAKVLSMSFAMPSSLTTLRTTVNNSGVLCVVSAGNESVDMSNTNATIGKRHDDPSWIIVGSLNSSGGKAAHSNYSSQYCDLFAPGESVQTLTFTMSNGVITEYKTEAVHGTSIAAPHVAAACALIMSHATHLTPLQVKERIMAGVNQISGFEDLCVSGGALSIKNVIETLYSENRGAYTKGDLNGDGYVDQFDYTVCRQIYMEVITPSSAQLDAGDVNNDGVVDMFDVLIIQNFYYQTNYFPPY